MVSKIKFYMDYFVSKLSLIYFSTFSGNRFNSDYIKIAILELVAAGCFSQARRCHLGHCEEMPRSFSFLNERPHTSAPLLHSHLDPCDSAVSVKTKQTASPQRHLLQCCVVLSYLSLRGDGSGTGRSDVLGHRVAASWWLVPPPSRAPLPLAAPAQAGRHP